MDERSKRNIRVGILLIAVLIALLLLRQCGENPALERIAFNRSDAPAANGVGGGDRASTSGIDGIEAERAWAYVPMAQEGERHAGLLTMEECRRRVGGYVPGGERDVTASLVPPGEASVSRAPGLPRGVTSPGLPADDLLPSAPAASPGGAPTIAAQTNVRGLPGVLLIGSPIAAAIGSIILDDDPPADSPG